MVPPGSAPPATRVCLPGSGLAFCCFETARQKTRPLGYHVDARFRLPLDGGRAGLVVGRALGIVVGDDMFSLMGAAGGFTLEDAVLCLLLRQF